MAERAGGTAVGLDDFAFVWLGTGLGLASVIGGQVRKGIGGAAGEIGWMPVHGAPLPVGNEHPGKAGLQALAGGLAVQALAAEYGFNDPTPADAIAAAIAALASVESGSGDSQGAAFLDELAHRVSIGVAAVCVVLDPSLVVLGGHVGKAGGGGSAPPRGPPGGRGGPRRPPRRRGSQDLPGPPGVRGHLRPGRAGAQGRPAVGPGAGPGQ